MTIRTLVLIAALIAVTAHADSVTVGATRYDDVYVAESASLYYISHPDTGTTTSVSKDDPKLGAVTISPDEDHRKELFARYQETRARNHPEIAANNRPTGLLARESTPIDTPAVAGSRPRPSVPLLEYHGTPRPHRVPIAPPQRGGGFAGNQQGFNVGGAPANMGGAQGGSIGGGNVGGGGRGAGQRGGAGFSNISQLFSTIDDRLVGEAPNPIAALR